MSLVNSWKPLAALEEMRVVPLPLAHIVLCPCSHNNTVLPKTLGIAH